MDNEFPLSVFPASVAKECAALAAHANVEVAIPACGFLAAVSAAAGMGLAYQMDAYSPTLPPNINLHVVGPSGAGKSMINPPMAAIYKIYGEMQAEWEEEVVLLKSEKAKLLKEIEKAAKDEDWTRHKTLSKDLAGVEKQIKSGKPFFLFEDFTVPALQSAFSGLDRPPYAIVASSEGRKIVQNLLSDHTGASTEGLWLQAWNRFGGDAAMRARVGDHLEDAGGSLSGIQMTSIVGIQPDLNSEIIKSKDLSQSGWTARRIFCSVDSKPLRGRLDIQKEMQARGIQHPDLRRWNEDLSELFKKFAFAPKVQICFPTLAAAQVLNDFSPEVDTAITGGKLSELEALARRWPEMAERLTLILHIMKHLTKAPEVEIEEETARNGVALMKWFSGHIKAGYWSVEGESRSARAEKVLAFAKKCGERGMNLGDLSKRGIGTAGETFHLVEALAETGKLVKIEPEKDLARRAAKPRYYWPQEKK